MNTNTVGNEIDLSVMSVPQLLDHVHARCQTLITRINTAKNQNDTVELNRLADISIQVQTIIKELDGRRIDHPTAVKLHKTLSGIHTK